jgi:predicted nuclease of restriction endonuclease-like (RecB) superfamily
MTRDIHSLADLMTEAANALIQRDPHRLEQLETIASNWMQADSEQMAQTKLLRAMIEAAYLLADEPSELEVDAAAH